ncbi:hypothetical protein PLICRDRAFT_175683 [Plicaturopsis crispa FD-325 SS-3]|nr:hypothetical protein PLICRDRAFT_175683 [Plicaturopsis crispa FD-325 SS-3]
MSSRRLLHLTDDEVAQLIGLLNNVALPPGLAGVLGQLEDLSTTHWRPPTPAMSSPALGTPTLDLVCPPSPASSSPLPTTTQPRLSASSSPFLWPGAAMMLTPETSRYSTPGMPVGDIGDHWPELETPTRYRNYTPFSPESHDAPYSRALWQDMLDEHTLPPLPSFDSLLLGASASSPPPPPSPQLSLTVDPQTTTTLPIPPPLIVPSAADTTSSSTPTQSSVGPARNKRQKNQRGRNRQGDPHPPGGNVHCGELTTDAELLSGRYAEENGNISNLPSGTYIRMPFIIHSIVNSENILPDGNQDNFHGLCYKRNRMISTIKAKLISYCY